MYETITVYGKDLKIWHPKRSKDGYVISDGGGWLPGIYDSREAALDVYKLILKSDLDIYSKLNVLSENVNSIYGEDRHISTDDLRTLYI